MVRSLSSIEIAQQQRLITNPVHDGVMVFAQVALDQTHRTGREHRKAACANHIVAQLECQSTRLLEPGTKGLRSHSYSRCPVIDPSCLLHRGKSTFRAQFVLFFSKRVITVLTPTKTLSSTAVSLELIISARIF